MFNQAEITVMQFTGHSLPVHQSMSVPWEFFSSSHFISKFPPTRFPLITVTRVCHFLPVHHLEWHFWPGRRSKYNSSSVLLELFDPGFWPVGFFRSSSGEARRWFIVSFSGLTSHPPCSFYCCWILTWGDKKSPLYSSSFNLGKLELFNIHFTISFKL